MIVHVAEHAARSRHPILAPPRTRVEETVLDLAQAAATAEDAYGWVTRALGRRLTNQGRLRDAMDARSRFRWRNELAEILGLDWAGVHSSLEYRYVRDVERPHGLPRSSRQVRVTREKRNEYRDVLYQDFGVAVELDGRAAHPGDLRWNEIWRDNAAAADGIVTLRFGWVDITQRPCLAASQLCRALRSRGCTDGHPCSPACSGTWPQ
jgi:hypothetical protein